ncbi:3648_t:CDS:1 [Diversispora eburnea]|uniref:3648_t:CDS:1 n=1 Tax=Diversispora eburnea TaxID=1213867 RepID=A0A9N8ZDL4_9GLOM|nr:3648_t:CDS:1 [Diversispora eburnea]
MSVSVSPSDTTSPSSSSSTLATTPNFDLRRSSSFIPSNPYPTKTTGISLSCLVNATATVVPNFKDDTQLPEHVYIFGGFHMYTDEVYNDLYRLNVAEMRWESMIYLKGKSPSKRLNHSASLWNQDKLIIFGGTDEEDQYCDDLIILDLNSMTWERPEISGFRPKGRAKHSATIYQDKLYIVGGNSIDDNDQSLVSTEVNCLNLLNWTWENPINLVPRHSHVSFIYRNRLYLYGGYNEDMDREKSLVIMDLITKNVSKIEITSDSCPEMNAGEHFTQMYGNQLVVVVTRCIKHGAQEVSIGIWTLDLDTFHWHKFEDGDRFIQGNWHYFAMAENSSRFFLFGVDERESDEYFSTVLTIDLQEYGMTRVPPPSIGFDFQQLMNDGTSSDFTIRSNDESSPVIYVHKIILLARWSHFSNMVNSGMTESHTSSLTIPEPYPTVLAFISFLYTDTLDSELSVDTVADLMVLGNMYLISRLTSLCCAHLQSKFDIENVAKIYHSASVAGAHALKKRAMRFINRNFGPVSKTSGFRYLPQEILFDFLDNLPEKAKISID